MNLLLTITPRDPLVARDGRPFGAGASERMRSLDWPYPSVLAGSLRTLVGKLAGGEFDRDTVEKLKELAVAGPLPVVDSELYLPVPADVAVHPDGRVFAARPASLKDGEGTDLPHGKLRPVLLPLGDEDEDFKPEPIPRFFSRDRLAEWLSAPAVPENFTVATEEEARRSDPGDTGFLPAPAKDERWHVRIDPETGTAAESELFMTTGLDYHLPAATGGSSGVIRLAARIDDASIFEDALKGLAHLHPLGGERRLAHWERAGDAERWKCPDGVEQALGGADKVRMALATPAIFAGGWLPGWLEDTPDGPAGVVPGASVRVCLVGASIERWQPVSGWSLETGRTGPKPVWRLVPAGGVYFFEVLEGDAAELAEKCWLRSVSDGEQHRRDGFGLAVWGVWGDGR